MNKLNKQNRDTLIDVEQMTATGGIGGVKGLSIKEKGLMAMDNCVVRLGEWNFRRLNVS